MREVVLYLSSALVRSFWSAVNSAGLPSTRETCIYKGDLRVVKMIKGLEYLWYKDRLKDLGLLSLQKKRLRGNLSMCINT